MRTVVPPRHQDHFFSALQSGLQDVPIGSKGSNEYLSRLTGYSLTSLNSEPSRIADEADFVQRELTGLCSRESKTFIDVHACSSSVSSALDDFSASLDDLFQAIPELEDECLSFAKSTRGIQLDRERASVILDQRDSLLDILEVPQLVDTCVRNGYYQEAMELASHVNRVAQRYPDLAIVRSVARSIESVMDMQLSQLLGLLRESIKLPVMAKTIGFLRRMDRLSEEELRIVFLESRVDHMRNAVEGLQGEKGDKIRYLRRYIDLFREIVYETVSQYNSIFMNIGSSSSGRYKDEGALDLIARYVQHNVLHLTSVIEENLAGIQDSSSLSSLLTQLGYSTMSFARIGIDFTALLRNPFEKAVESLVTTGWQLATDQVVNGFDEASKAEMSPGSWLCSEEGRLSIMSDTSSPPARPAIQSPSVPPAYLTAFPPLAIYLNQGLSILNSLRLLAPTRSRHQANQALIASMAQLIARFRDYVRTATDDRLKPSTRRPDSMRRNTSISNQGQLLEQDRARVIESRRILVAAADAILDVLFPFLTSAMDNVVYTTSAGDQVSAPYLGEAESELRQWLEGNREKPKDVPANISHGEADLKPAESVMNPVLPNETPEEAVTPALAKEDQPSKTAGIAVQEREEVVGAAAESVTKTTHTTDIHVKQESAESTGERFEADATPASELVMDGKEKEAEAKNIALDATAANIYDFTQTDTSVLVIIAKKKAVTVDVSFGNNGIQLCIDGDTTIDLSPLSGAFNSEGVTTTMYKKKVEVSIPKTNPGETWETLIAES